MEGFDGYAALAAVRYQPRTSAIPVILMTGQPDEQGRRFAMELGADDYLNKPFTPSELLTSIHVQFKKQSAIKQQALDIERAAHPETRESGGIESRSDGPNETSLPQNVCRDTSIVTPRAIAQVATGGILVPANFPSDARAEPEQVTSSISPLESYVETFLRMVNCFHPNLGNTAMRAVALCNSLAGLCDLSVKDAQDLCCSAALHDISLVGLEREAVGRWLRDPRKVTEEEDAYIKQHPAETQRMLQDLPVFEGAGRIIRSHHENWDGTGYPDRLQNETIPWLPRILSAVLFYCNQHTLGAPALKRLQAMSGKVFDPKAVAIVADAAVNAKIPRGVREILLNELRPGQVVAGEIYNSSGMALVHSERELTESLISKLMSINRVTPLDQFVLVYC